MPSTIFQFKIEANYGKTFVEVYSKTESYKRIFLLYGTKAEVLSGFGKNKSLITTPDKIFLSIDDKGGVFLTVMGVVAKGNFQAIPIGFFDQLEVSGKAYHPLKSSAYYRIECVHPVTKTVECGILLQFENWQNLPASTP